MKRVFLGTMLLLGVVSSRAQLVVDNSLTAEQLVRDVLVGACVEVGTVTFNGLPGSHLDEQAGTFNGVNADIGLATGLILATGNIAVALGPNDQGGATMGGSGAGGDPDLTLLSGVNTNDKAVLEFDFIPAGDVLSFRYVFASEEYNEYVCATVNDAFGFFLSGPGINGPFQNNAINLATLPGSDIPVTINTVNNGTPGSASGGPQNCIDLDPNWTANSIYYTDNGGSMTIQFDGMTVVLTATSPVICGETYHIKLAIADGGDSAWDSGVFIEAGSFSSSPVTPEIVFQSQTLDVIFESCLEMNFNLVPSYCDELLDQVIYFTYSGTATNGVDIVPALPDSVVFVPGEPMPSISFTAPIDEDGDETLIITITAIDCVGEEVTEDFSFTITSMPPMTITGTGGPFLCGQSVPLVPQVTGGLPGYTYLWSTNETTATISPTPTESTTYTVTVTDPCGVSVSHDFETTLLPAPAMPVSILGAAVLQEGCDDGLVVVQRPAGVEGDLILDLITSGSATSGTDYIFGPGLVIPAGEGTIEFIFNTLADQIEEGAENAVLAISFTNACAQTVGDTVEFTILNVDPFTLALANVEEECSNDSLQVFATIDGGTAPFTYIWSTGDTIVNANDTWITLAYEQTVTVTVTDGCGATVAGSFQLILDCIPQVPNVFTPNGDGQNDTFHIAGTAGRPTQVRIFNRWGQMVMEAANYQNNWRAQDLPEGTYFYEVIIRDHEPLTGHLTILRDRW